MSNCLIIGAYGGEHVGDAAILGGVIHKIQQLYQINSLDILSIRVHRTERWVDGLELKDKMRVRVLDLYDSGSLSGEYDYLVYAGGPIMDLPFQYSYFLKIINRIKKNGGKFIIEGVGYGPFKKKISKFLAKKLLQKADQITARTKEAMESITKINDNVELTRDPAFDYLEFLNKENIPKTDVTKVGINLRPLWDKYNFSSISKDEIEEKVILSIINTIEAASDKDNVVFYLVPLNSDQFGFSDLNILSRIKQQYLYNNKVILCENEFDPTSLYKLISTFDVFISMRFHGCIFGLANGYTHVVGLDYTIGKKGKVSEILSDRINSNCIGVEDLLSDENAITNSLHDIFKN